MILYAINISSGGGKVLLDEVLLKQPLGKPHTLFLDERYKLPDGFNFSNVQIFKVKPRLINRVASEFKLRQTSRNLPKEDVICFGNLPPIFRLPSKTIVYLQNALLLKSIRVPKDNLKILLRNLYERLWFSLFIKNSDAIWVQTNWMKNSLPKTLKEKAFLKPIFPTLPEIRESSNKTRDFVAVTGTIKYKNLIPLLEGIRDAEIINKNFTIISDGTSDNIQKILLEIKQRNIKVDFLTGLNREEVFSILATSKCLILTSQLESFCLPLHEALHYKLDIIAGNFDFVTEYVKPTIILENTSSYSIKKSLILYSTPAP